MTVLYVVDQLRFILCWSDAKNKTHLLVVLEAILILISLFATNHWALERFSIFGCKGGGRTTHPSQELLLLQTVRKWISDQLGITEELMKLVLSAEETFGWLINIQLSHIMAVGDVESAPFGIARWHAAASMHRQNISSG